MMKVVFFGLGSIGQRHAQILLKNYHYELYAFRSGVNNLKNSLGIKELDSWDKVIKLAPDLAFITNPTVHHIETAIKCAEIGCKLFIEKPIGKDLQRLNDLIKIVKRKELVSYVGYNLRFHPVIVKVKKYIDKYKPLHGRAVCTSFLPGWRPAQDYLMGYSANASMGGGVILDLSHELDYVSYLVGEIEKISGKFARMGKVTIDAEDYADILVSTRMCPVNVHINFLSHFRQRYIQIDFDELTVVGDIANSEVREYKNEVLKNSYKLKYDYDQDYKEQMKYFFKNINNPKMMNNLIEAEDLFKKIIVFKNTIHE